MMVMIMMVMMTMMLMMMVISFSYCLVIVSSTHSMLQLGWILLDSDFTFILPRILSLRSSYGQRASLLGHSHKGAPVQLRKIIIITVITIVITIIIIVITIITATKARPSRSLKILWNWVASLLSLSSL